MRPLLLASSAGLLALAAGCAGNTGGSGEAPPSPTCTLGYPSDGVRHDGAEVVEVFGRVGDPLGPAEELSVEILSDTAGPVHHTGPDEAGEVLATLALEPGPQVLTLRATAADGRSCRDLAVFRVVAAPELTWLAPEGELQVAEGESLTARVRLSDPDDVPEDLELRWSSDLDGELGEGTLAGDEATWTGTLGPGVHALVLTATDPDGLEASAGGTVVVDGRPSQPELLLEPDPATTEDELVLSLLLPAEDPEGDEVSYALSWTVDGELTEETGWTVPAERTLRGETWEVTVVPWAGGLEGPPAQASLTVDNAAPRLESLRLSPDPVASTGSLSCSPQGGVDPDGDPVVYTWAWEVDGSDPGVKANALSSDHFAPGDEITCYARPTDGDAEGDLVASNTVTVNHPPELTLVALSPDPVAAGEDLTCSAVAVDDDGDSVTFSYSWTVDGVARSETSDTLSGGAAKHEVVACEVNTEDAVEIGESGSASLTVSNTPPVLDTLSLGPTGAATEDTLLVSATASDHDGDSVQFFYSWAVDGVAISPKTSTLDCGTWCDKGEVVTVTVTPDDTEHSGVSKTASLTVANTPPGAPEVALTPESPVEGEDDLLCEVATESEDADGDTISYTASWTVDGTAWSGATSSTTHAGDTVAAADLVADETWTCTLTPDDGDDTGTSASASATVAEAWEGWATADVDLDTADLIVTGTRADDGLGARVSGTVDLDGDGLSDLLLGSPGATVGGDSSAGTAWLIWGSEVAATTGEAEVSGLASWELEGEGASHLAAAHSAWVGDVDGDGISELALAAPGAESDAGRVYLLSGADFLDSSGAAAAGSLSTGDADWQVDGVDAEDFLGAPGIVGDVDGDGLDDLFLGAVGEDSGGEDAGSAWLFLASSLGSSGSFDQDEADLQLVGEAAGDEAGTEVTGGDLDGDGLSELILSAPMEDSAASCAGAVYVVLGSGLGTGSLDLSAADYRILGEAECDQLGTVLDARGDVDGDGQADLLLTARYNDETASKAGKAWLFSGASLTGSTPGDLDAGDADWMVVGEAAGDQLGVAAILAGDLDNDGLDDVLIGADGHDGGATAGGSAWLLLSRYLPTAGSGVDTVSDIYAHQFQGVETSERATSGGLQPAGDLDGDGLGDIVVGAPGSDLAASDAGTVYVFIAP